MDSRFLPLLSGSWVHPEPFFCRLIVRRKSHTSTPIFTKAPETIRILGIPGTESSHALTPTAVGRGEDGHVEGRIPETSPRMYASRRPEFRSGPEVISPGT